VLYKSCKPLKEQCSSIKIINVFSLRLLSFKNSQLEAIVVTISLAILKINSSRVGISVTIYSVTIRAIISDDCKSLFSVSMIVLSLNVRIL
jgi:hypothetical protein